MNYLPRTTSQRDYPDPAIRSFASAISHAKERRAEWILLTALALNVLEGAIRKWIIGSEGTQLSYLAYFSKDIIFASLLLLPARGGSFEARDVFRRWLVPGCLLLGFGAVLGSIGEFNVVGAALTLRAVIFLPLLAYYAVPRIKGVSLQSVAWLLALFTVLNFGLGVVQNSLPADDILNRYAGDSLDIVEVRSGVRATGTFSYITGMSMMSTVGVWAGLVLITIRKNLWLQMVGLAVLASGFGCGLASVSRGPILAGVLIVFIWTLSSGAILLLTFRSLVAGTIFAALVIFFGLNSTFSGLQEGLLERHEEAGDSLEVRSLGQLEEALDALNRAPLGIGLGTEQVGGNYYKNGEMVFTTYEHQLPRLVLETGIIGLVGFLLVSAGAVVALQAAKRDAVTRNQKAVLLATQLMLIPLFYMSVVFNHTGSAFVWIIFAAVLSDQYPDKKRDAVGNG